MDSTGLLRAEITSWMGAHLTGDFAQLSHRGHLGDGDALPDLRKEWERELADGGWSCVGWPRAHGGRDLSIAEQVAFHEEYHRAGGPGRMGHIGEGLVGPTLMAFGTDAQKARFLPAILRGEEFWCQGYSEPSAGSDLSNLKTRARRDAVTGDWIVTGQKVWTSLAHVSDWIFVLARAEEDSVGRRGLVFLLMPLDQPGIEIRPIRQMSGSAEFNEVFFDGAIAKAEHLVGAPGDGWKIGMALLGFERGLSTLGQQMGFAHELDLIIELARENGAARDPIIRNRIARAWGGLRAMRHHALRVLAGFDSPALSQAALTYKYQWSNWHRDLGKLAADLMGPEAGVLDEADPRRAALHRLFLFSRADTIYGGTNEIQLNIIAEQGLGMPKERRGEE